MFHLPYLSQKNILAIVVLLCGSLLTGCTSNRGESTTAPKPFQLKAKAQLEHRSSQRIKAASGGQIEANGSDGTRYRLTLPAGALRADTTVTLTPLERIEGIPGQVRHYGVDIEPAGTRLLKLARLEINSQLPLVSKDTYWFETQGTPTALQARPGFPGIGQPGVMLFHFSGATVAVGSTATSAAIHEGVYDPTYNAYSSSWLQWYRNVVEQDYQSGRIDHITHDAKIKIIDDRLNELTIKEGVAKLEEATRNLNDKLDKLGNQADAGDLADFETIQQAFLDTLQVERQNQLLGIETHLQSKLVDVFKRYYDALLSHCDKQPLKPEFVLSMERQAELFGYSKVGTSEYEKCLPKSYSASGGGQGLQESGEVLDPMKPFELQGRFPGGTSVHKYTPTSPNGGTSSVTASGSGVIGHGQGTYTLTRQGENWVLKDTVTGCVDGVPGSCRTTNVVITLTGHVAY